MTSPLFFTYHVFTLLFLAGFALYDKRHHRIRNAALLAFLPWCLLSPLLMYFTFPEFSPAYWGIRSAAGFGAGFVLLLAVSLATNGGIGGGDIAKITVHDWSYVPSGKRTEDANADAGTPASTDDGFMDMEDCGENGLPFN